MTAKEILTHFKETVEELREDLKGQVFKYNVSYIEGYTDALDEFQETTTILELEEEEPAKDETTTDNFNLIKFKNVVDELECDLIKEMDFTAENEEDKAYHKGIEYALRKLKELTK